MRPTAETDRSKAMRSISKTAAAFAILFVMSIADVPYLSRMLTPDAHALRGRGAAFAVGAAAGSASSSSAATAQQQAATAQQQSATAQQQSATAQQQATTAQQPAAQQPAAPVQSAVAASGNPLPLGTVVPVLPSGCTATPVGGVNYYYCGGNFYQAVYEGSTLKYVTTKPK
jgi:hypothetical protein